MAIDEACDFLWGDLTLGGHAGSLLRVHWSYARRQQALSHLLLYWSDHFQQDPYFDERIGC